MGSGLLWLQALGQFRNQSEFTDGPYFRAFRVHDAKLIDGIFVP